MKAGPWYSNEEMKLVAVLDMQDPEMRHLGGEFPDGVAAPGLEAHEALQGRRHGLGGGLLAVDRRAVAEDHGGMALDDGHQWQEVVMAGGLRDGSAGRESVECNHARISESEFDPTDQGSEDTRMATGGTIPDGRKKVRR